MVRKLVASVKKSVMKSRDIAIYKGKSGGLSKGEASEVLSVIRRAKSEGKVPAMSFEHSASILYGKDPLYLIPTQGDISRTAVKVRAILNTAFKGKYTVGV